MDDLDDIMSGRSGGAPSTEPTPTPADLNPAPDTASQPNPPQEPQPEPQDDSVAPMVPRAALEQEREKRRKYTDELADVRKEFSEFRNQFSGFMQAFQTQQRPPQPAPQPAPVPDIWDDPNAFVRHQVNQAVEPVQQQAMMIREQTSQMIAEQQHGEDVVGAAYQALAAQLQRDPRAQYEYQRIMASRHPYGELVKWHQQHQTLSEIGSDPNAYREKIRAELLAELQASPPAQQQQPAGAPPMPTSFTQARNAGPRTAPQYSGPQALSEIMKR